MAIDAEKVLQDYSFSNQLSMTVKNGTIDSDNNFVFDGDRYKVTGFSSSEKFVGGHYSMNTESFYLNKLQ